MCETLNIPDLYDQNETFNFQNRVKKLGMKGGEGTIQHLNC